MSEQMDQWLKQDFIDALAEERRINAELECECNEMSARLNRLEEHLQKLAMFAADEMRDPYPEPAKPKGRKK